MGRSLSIDELRELGIVNAYIIMPRYGKNLSNFLIKNELDLSVASIIDLGRRVLQQLKAVHKAGYVYNDLKPDNIMLNYSANPKEEHSEVSCFEGVNLHLVDFGFCTVYKDRKNGELYPREIIKKFRGNLRYASAD
mmetsp:Transcript_37766/g.57823  ORF Transcript_37766/g.57823 Transcript_37766/m.57823 type:complete len:136 (+) Transcript_37766:384-791(+)